MKILTQISRIFVGVLFILSGLIKANDALGFSYKLDEYFEVFNVQSLTQISLALAMIICVFEIVVGVALLVGYRVKLTVWVLLIMIVFFTWLTGYSAITGKVTDCGCFGDAVKLKPVQSFYKDLILLAFILILFFGRKYINPLFSERSRNIIIFGSLVITSWFTIHCYRHLPVKDFRPYAIGKNILQGMTLPDNARRDSFKIALFYEKNGQVKEFNTSNAPYDDSTWVWKDTKSVLVREGDKAPIHDFSITDAEGVNHAEEFLSDPGYLFIVVSYDIKKTDVEAHKKINDFAQKVQKAGVRIIGLSGSTYQVTDVFRHELNLMYDYYFCDQTAVKTMIRSNPGLMMLKGGTVVNMWHYNDLPDFEKLRAEYKF